MKTIYSSCHPVMSKFRLSACDSGLCAQTREAMCTSVASAKEGADNVVWGVRFLWAYNKVKKKTSPHRNINIKMAHKVVCLRSVW